ncbi:FUSC family protein [Lichenicoccus sp.]|uniref:FUSC family protein n=1 Tax=Lichenicoccus sp. TaxID=2781899 RepID=UPI003D0FBB2A
MTLPRATPAGRSLRIALGDIVPFRRHGPTVIYCLRTVTAIGVALYVAFSLQLQAPLSSVITVLIVANPVSGALVSKSVWRLFGTFIGASAAILLMAAFAQSPILFYLALSLWIGAACVFSTLLRFFKAYGAVLAGYTIIIVCASAFAHPETVFLSALSRLSAVSVGIASAALVFLLTSVRPPQRLADATQATIRGTAASLADAGGCFRQQAPPADATESAAAAMPRPGALPEAFYDSRGALLAQASGLVEIIEYAAADSYDVARRAGRLRAGAASLLGTLAALHPLHRRLHRSVQDTAQAEQAIAALGRYTAAEAPRHLAALAAAHDRLAESVERGHVAGLAELGAVERARDLLNRLHEAVARLSGQPSRTATPRHVRLRPYLDWPTALRNGLRGCIVTMLGCLFWYVTQWPSGPTLLSYLVPAACLLATNPSASRASIDFSLGTLLAIPASYVCETLMLPQITGFPLLLGCLVVVLLPGIWLQFHPRHGLRAFGYVVFFNAMISVNNPIRFDDIALVNGWLAFILGTAALVVVFRAVLPPNPARDTERLVASLGRATARLGGTRRPPPHEVWENLQLQKTLRLTQRVQAMAGPVRRDLIDSAFISVEIGRDVLRLRLLLHEAALASGERAAVQEALDAIGRIRRDPRAAARATATAATALSGGTGPTARRIAGLLHEVSILIDAVPDFLAGEAVTGLRRC